MSEYRTHLRESVAALRDAAERLCQTLGEGTGVSEPPFHVPPMTAVEAWDMLLTVWGKDAASPAPSAPAARRWWLNLYGRVVGASHPSRESADEHAAPSRLECVEVVEAAAFHDALARATDALLRLAAAQRDANDLRAKLAAAERELAQAKTVTREQVEKGVLLLNVCLATRSARRSPLQSTPSASPSTGTPNMSEKAVDDIVARLRLTLDESIAFGGGVSDEQIRHAFAEREAFGSLIIRRPDVRLLLDALAASQREAERLREDAERWSALVPYVERLRETLVAHVWPDDESAHKRRLRDALIGQVSDPVFYSRWERCKADVRELLDALDAALRPEVAK